MRWIARAAIYVIAACGGAAPASADFVTFGPAVSHDAPRLHGSPTATRDLAFVYSANGRYSGYPPSIDSYRLDPDGVTLSFVETEDADVAGGGIAVPDDGGHVYVTGDASSILIYSRDPISGEIEFVETVTPVSAAVPELSSPSAIAISPDGAYVYFACPPSNSIVRFQRSLVTGSLAAPIVISGFAQLVSMALAPDGSTIYVTSSGDSSLHVFTRDSGTGDLIPLETHSNGVAGVTGLSHPGGISIPPDGGTVYVGAYPGSPGAIFHRVSATGALTFVSAGPGQPVAGNRYVWSTSGDFRETVVLFERDPTTSETTLIEYADNVSTPYFVSPDGEVAFGWTTQRVVRPSSLLRLVQALPRDSFGDGGTSRAFQTHVTHDGRSVLMLTTDAKILIFRRNLVSGHLSFVEAETEGLASPRRLAVSPDGRFVYVADQTSGLLRFARDLATGELAAAPSLDTVAQEGVRDVTLNGESLYTMPEGSSQIDSYARDTLTGGVSYLDSLSVAELAYFVDSPSESVFYAGALINNGWMRIARDPSGTLGNAVFVQEQIWGLMPISDSYVFTGSITEWWYEPGSHAQIMLYDGTQLEYAQSPAGVLTRGAPSCRLTGDGCTSVRAST